MEDRRKDFDTRATVKETDIFLEQAGYIKTRDKYDRIKYVQPRGLEPSRVE